MDPVPIKENSNLIINKINNNYDNDGNNENTFNHLKYYWLFVEHVRGHADVYYKNL